jgi:hypothetical protein
MATLLHVIHIGSLSEPEIPIQSFGDGHGFEWTFAKTGGDEYGHLFQFADASIANRFARQMKSLAAALLGAGLENNAVVAHGFDDMFAFVNSQRERFLAVNILLRLCRGDVDQGMPVVGHCLDYDINLVMIEEFAEIIELRGCLATPAKLPSSGIYMGLINVTQGNNVPVPTGVPGIAASHSAATDERNARSVVRAGGRAGSGFLCRRQGSLDEPERQSSGGSRGRAGGEEASAGNPDVLVHKLIERRGFTVVKRTMSESSIGKRKPARSPASP